MDSISRPPLPAVDALAETSGRAKGRDSLFLMATLTIGNDRAARDVRVRNLSAGGLMAELDRPTAEGTPVALSLRGIGEISGAVAWCAEGRMGIAFDEPIDPLLARKPVGKGARTPGYAKPQLR